jgi:hypothetical protein
MIGSRAAASRTPTAPATPAGHRPALDPAHPLDGLGVANSGVVDAGDPMPYSVVVFRDPDNIQLELFYMAG